MSNTTILNNRFKNFYRWIVIALSIALKRWIVIALSIPLQACVDAWKKEAQSFIDTNVEKLDTRVEEHKLDVEKRVKILLTQADRLGTKHTEELTGEVRILMDEEQKKLKNTTEALKQDVEQIMSNQATNLKHEFTNIINNKTKGLVEQLSRIELQMSAIPHFFNNAGLKKSMNLVAIQILFNSTQQLTDEEGVYKYSRLSTSIDNNFKTTEEIEKLREYINKEFTDLINNTPKDYACILYLLSLKKGKYLVTKSNATEVLKGNFVTELTSQCDSSKEDKKVVLDVFNKAENNDALAKLCSKVMMEGRNVKQDYTNLITAKIEELHLNNDIATSIKNADSSENDATLLANCLALYND
jgi:hypothetical protein